MRRRRSQLYDGATRHVPDGGPSRSNAVPDDILQLTLLDTRGDVRHQQGPEPHGERMLPLRDGAQPPRCDEDPIRSPGPMRFGTREGPIRHRRRAAGTGRVPRRPPAPDTHLGRDWGSSGAPHPPAASRGRGPTRRAAGDRRCRCAGCRRPAWRRSTPRSARASRGTAAAVPPSRPPARDHLPGRSSRQTRYTCPSLIGTWPKRRPAPHDSPGAIAEGSNRTTARQAVYPA